MPDPILDRMSEAFAVGEILLDADGEPCDSLFIDVNPAFERMTGLNRERTIGARMSEILPDEDAGWLRICRKVALTGEPACFESRSRARDRWYELSAFSPAPGRFAVVFTDITRRKSMEEALRRAEAKYRGIFEACSGGIILHDRTGRILEANPAACEMLGLSQDQVRVLRLADPPWRAVREDGSPLPDEEHPTMVSLRTGKPVRDVVVGVPPQGPEGAVVKWFLVTSEPLVNPRTGEIESAVSTFINISKRKRAEERTAALQAITAALSAARTPAQVAQVMFGIGLPAMGAKGAALCIPAGPGMLKVLHESGGDTTPRPAFRTDDGTPASDAFRTGEPVWIGNALTYRALYPGVWESRTPGEVAHAALPLYVQDRKIGTIGLSFASPQEFDPGGRKFIVTIAAQCAQALDRARLYEAEQLAKIEAEEANAAKDQFIAMVSHELRNPLSAIDAGLGVLRHSACLEGRLQEALEIAERNTRLQARLINDLLDVSRLSRGKLHLQRAPVVLEAVVRAAIDAQRPDTEASHIQVTMEIEPGLWVHGDFDRLQQVVMNLLSNSTKFTPPGGRVIVRTSRSGEKARITVEDNGIGIDSRMLSTIFDMFQQGEVGTRRAGLGLGLALVKGISERHGGRVWAESQGTGQGSRFTVELPLLAIPENNNAAPRNGSSRSKIRVLLIEDNPDTRTLVADNLETMGYVVLAASSGEEGLDLLGQWTPDLIIADVGLPGMDGFEFLTRVRSVPGLADVPAFAVTGYGSEEDLRRGRDAGYAGHFIKPVDLGALDRRVREWLALHP